MDEKEVLLLLLMNEWVVWMLGMYRLLVLCKDGWVVWLLLWMNVWAAWLLLWMDGWWIYRCSTLQFTRARKRRGKNLFLIPIRKMSEEGRRKKTNNTWQGRKTGYMYNVLYVYQGQQKLRFLDYHIELCFNNL